jgi:hypothetical protein
LDNRAANFSTLISATPAAYGLTTADAANIASAYAAWSSAHAIVTSPTTKTAASVAAKNAARTTLLAIVRPYAQQISLNAGVASSGKVAVGVNPRTSTPSPITAPASNPVLTIQAGGNLTVVLRYRDSAASVSVKSKPYGVVACEIWGAVSATPVADPSALAFVVDATKSPLTLQRPPSDGGKQLYLAARWKTRTGGYSPWSAIVNFTVPTSVLALVFSFFQVRPRDFLAGFSGFARSSSNGLVPRF